jgi:hypothetical protein
VQLTIFTPLIIMNIITLSKILDIIPKESRAASTLLRHTEPQLFTDSTRHPQRIISTPHLRMNEITQFRRLGTRMKVELAIYTQREFLVQCHSTALIALGAAIIFTLSTQARSGMQSITWVTPMKVLWGMFSNQSNFRPSPMHSTK